VSSATLLLGVGCQNGGTTWIHHYISTLPEANLGLLKDYHALDNLFLQRCTFMLESRLQRTRARIDAKLAALDRPAHKITAALAAELRLLSLYTSLLYTSLENYAQFFADHARAEGVKLTGDITPAYAMLGAEHFARVRRVLTSKGFNVRVVFLMRDPVERVVSAMNMALRTMPEHKRKTAGPIERFVGRHYADEDTELRTRHDRTIKARVDEGAEFSGAGQRRQIVQLPQSELASSSPLQASKDWCRLGPQLFKKQAYCISGCDTYA
jgi:hypothetical protein